MAGYARLEHDGSEEAGVGEELPAQDDAELVALGVREHDVVGVGILPDVDVPRTEREQPIDDFSLVFDGLADQVEMDGVLSRSSVPRPERTPG